MNSIAIMWSIGQVCLKMCFGSVLRERKQSLNVKCAQLIKQIFWSKQIFSFSWSSVIVVKIRYMLNVYVLWREIHFKKKICSIRSSINSQEKNNRISRLFEKTWSKKSVIIRNTARSSQQDEPEPMELWLEME